MSTTLLPFLYQTRTLQLLSRTGVSTPAFARFYGQYDRRANNRKPQPKKAPRYPVHEYDPEFDKVSTESIPFELPEGYERPPPREISHLFTSEGDRTTITPTEKEAFKAIFEELEEKRERSAQPEDLAKIGVDTVLEPATASTVPIRRVAPDPAKINWPPEEPSVEDRINIIIQDAAESQEKSRRHLHEPYPGGHPLSQTRKAKEWDKALLRFPPSLRNAARRALGVIDDAKDSEKVVPLSAPTDLFQSPTQQRLSAEIDFALNPLAKSVEHEALRRAEQKRIEELMEAAKTDFELWDVMEKEVFPLVDRLGLSPKSRSAPVEKKKGRKGKESATAAEIDDHKKADLPMHIYGPLFPRLLLSALRMLDQNFTHPSPLALNVLPRIKETGHAGYVLGASTSFYNALARIEWYRYGNPANVFNLFEEMRHAGLLCDLESKGIQESIEQWFWKARWDKTARNPFLREILSLPEWEFALAPRIQHWATTITLQLQEQRNAVKG
ncbi:hypothetical protein QBC35DRAFT_298404 [Podospora australis]|uniref:Mtf2-like C-terminal domain-containing protein n=1 Tax=Podospora australis TaxID=1536484 RepID=A0AAN6WSS3_9PEZI|nr:hypothetical protein QBC35DRAFT_298404 [Podospora australis]